MHVTEITFSAHDATQLFMRVYAPEEAADLSRTLVVVHGTSEHGGRYDHFARMAAASGWRVVVPDLRGHGLSGGIPVHADRFERYLQDLESLWQFMELNPRRTAVIGHSFGGLIALRFAETRGSKFSALTLMSPLLRLTVEVDRFTLVLGKLMSWIAPTTRFKSRVSAEHTCRSPEVLARREQDPLIHRSITARWFFEMQDAIADGWSDADSLTMPVLALQAGDDKIVDPLAVEPWLLSTHSSDRTFHSLPGHYHELLNEPDWETTGQTVLEWLDARVRSLAVAH